MMRLLFFTTAPGGALLRRVRGPTPLRWYVRPFRSPTKPDFRDELLAATLKSQEKALDGLLESLKSQDKALDVLRDSMALSKEMHAREVAALKYELDVATGRVDARSMLEVCINELWRLSGSDVFSAKGTKSKLASLLSGDKNNIICSRLLEYLKVLAEDNGLSEIQVLQQAPKVYEILCARMHSQNTEGRRKLPSEVFESLGIDSMAAFAAIVHATGRDLRLYAPHGDIQLKLRVGRRPKNSAT